MIKSILLFIKAHTIATAITTTVVVSTVVATPIIINQVQKPEQEIETGQVQENIIDNIVIDDTEENEIPEENTIDENTTVPEEEQKEENKNQETTKPTTSSSNTSTTKPTTNNNKTETPKKQDGMGGSPDDFETPKTKEPKFITFGYPNNIKYDEANKIVYQNYPLYEIRREDWLNDYNFQRQQFLDDCKRLRDIDESSGKYTKDYCQKKVAQYAEEVYRYQGALEYLKLHENDIQSISNANNEFLYEGKYYSNYSGTLEGCINVASKNKADWEQNLKTAPQYSPSEQKYRDYISELDKAYNYIKSH